MTFRNERLSTTKSTCNVLRLNIGLCYKRLHSDWPNDGMYIDLSGIIVLGINDNFISEY